MPDKLTTPTFRALDEAKIIGTLERLRNRIDERFPESGLGEVAEELIAVGKEASECVAYLRAPNWAIRIAAGLVIAGMLAVLIVAIMTLQRPDVHGLAEVVQLLEAGINDIVFFGIAVFFLLTIETRLKRRRALRGDSRVAQPRARSRHASTDQGPGATAFVGAEYAFIARADDDAPGARALPRLLQRTIICNEQACGSPRSVLQ